MENVLAFKLDDCLLIEYRILADGTMECILIFIVLNRLLLSPSLLSDLVERNIVLLFIYFLENPRVRLEPLFGRLLTHTVHGRVHCLHCRVAGYVASARMICVVLSAELE